MARSPDDEFLHTVRSDVIPVGASVRLVSLSAIAQELGVSVAVIRRLMYNLGVPVLAPAGDEGPQHVNLPSLEIALYATLRPCADWRIPAIERAREFLKGDQSPLINEMGFVAQIYGPQTRAALYRRVIQLTQTLRRAGEEHRRKHRVTDNHKRGDSREVRFA